jgi:hypothetical protein
MRSVQNEADKGLVMTAKGSHITEEHKQKIRIANMGRIPNIETRKRMSDAQKGHPSSTRGKHLTEETRHKISIANIGRPAWNKGLTKLTMPSIEIGGKKISQRLKGRKLTEKHRINIGKGSFGHRLSDESKHKISLALRGKKRSQPSWNKGLTKETSPIVAALVCKSGQTQKGKHLSEEHKHKLHVAMKGRVFTDEWRKKMSIAATGRKHDSATIEKLRVLHIGYIPTQEQRLKIGLAHRGRKCTPASKQRMSIAQKLKYQLDLDEGKSRSGENAPNWQGGLSFIHYTKTWQPSFKKRVRFRDNHKCQFCGGTSKLTIHHIDYDKANCKLLNLITLCRSCHSKTNYHRPYWQDYFTNLMIFRFQEDRII